MDRFGAKCGDTFDWVFNRTEIENNARILSLYFDYILFFVVAETAVWRAESSSFFLSAELPH